MKCFSGLYSEFEIKVVRSKEIHARLKPAPGLQHLGPGESIFLVHAIGFWETRSCFLLLITGLLMKIQSVQRA